MKRHGGTLYKSMGGDIVNHSASEDEEEETSHLLTINSTDKPKRPIFRAVRKLPTSTGSNPLPNSTDNIPSSSTTGSGLFKNVQLVSSSTVRTPSTTSTTTPSTTTNILSNNTTLSNSRLPLSSSLSFGSIGASNDTFSNNNNSSSSSSFGGFSSSTVKDSITTTSGLTTPSTTTLPKSTLSFGMKSASANPPATTSTTKSGIVFGKKSTTDTPSNVSSTPAVSDIITNTPASTTVVPTTTSTASTSTFRFGKSNATPAVSTTTVTTPSVVTTVPKVAIEIKETKMEEIRTPSTSFTFGKKSKVNDTTTNDSINVVPMVSNISTPSTSVSTKSIDTSVVTAPTTSSIKFGLKSTPATISTPAVPSSIPIPSVSTSIDTPKAIIPVQSTQKSISTPAVPTTSSSSLTVSQNNNNNGNNNDNDRRKNYLRKLISLNKGYSNWITKQIQNPTSYAVSWEKEAQLYLQHIHTIEKEFHDILQNNNSSSSTTTSSSSSESSSLSVTTTIPGQSNNLKFSFHNLQPNEEALKNHHTTSPGPAAVKPQLTSSRTTGPLKFSFNATSSNEPSVNITNTNVIEVSDSTEPEIEQTKEISKSTKPTFAFGNKKSVPELTPAPAPVTASEPVVEKKSFTFGKRAATENTTATTTASSIKEPSVPAPAPEPAVPSTTSTSKFTFGTKRKEMENDKPASTTSAISSLANTNPTETTEEPTAKRSYSFGRKPDSVPAFGPRKDRTNDTTTTTTTTTSTKSSLFNPVDSTTSEATKSTNDNNEEDEDDDEDNLDKQEKPSLLLPTETIIYEVTARLHRLGEKTVVANASNLSEKDIKDGNYERVTEKTWLNMDVGQLRILKDTVSQKSRIIFSPPNSTRPVLNAILSSNSKISLIPKDPKANDSKVRLDCLLIVGGVLNRYQVTVKTPAQGNELVAAFTSNLNKK